MHIVPVGAMVEQVQLVRENAALGGIDTIWLANNHHNLDTYWTEY